MLIRAGVAILGKVYDPLGENPSRNRSTCLLHPPGTKPSPEGDSVYRRVAGLVTFKRGSLAA
jgi:hypothetical protein